MSGGGDLTCEELVELVTTYLEEGLVPEDHARFEAHLEECEGCEIYLDQARETVRLVGRLREEHLDPAARDRLLAAFRDWKREA